MELLGTTKAAAEVLMALRKTYLRKGKKCLRERGREDKVRGRGDVHGRTVIQAAAPCQSRWIWPKVAANHAKPTLEQKKE